MTAPTDTELRILRLFADGAPTPAICRETGLGLDVVSAALTTHARNDRGRAQIVVRRTPPPDTPPTPGDMRPADPAPDAEPPTPTATPAAPDPAPPADPTPAPDGHADLVQWSIGIAEVLAEAGDSPVDAVRVLAGEVRTEIDHAVTRLLKLRPLLHRRQRLATELADVDAQLADVAGTQSPPDVLEARMARRWARSTGVPCPDRGPVPHRVITAWANAGRPIL